MHQKSCPVQRGQDVVDDLQQLRYEAVSATSRAGNGDKEPALGPADAAWWGTLCGPHGPPAPWCIVRGRVYPARGARLRGPRGHRPDSRARLLGPGLRPGLGDTSLAVQPRLWGQTSLQPLITLAFKS